MERTDNGCPLCQTPAGYRTVTRIGIAELVRGRMLKTKVASMSKMCDYCDDAPCIAGCAVRAIMKRYDGLVIINPEKCTGCKVCAPACPHNANDPKKEEVNISATCTLKDSQAEEKFTTKTDGHGDFWFHGLAANRTYTLTIKTGKVTKTIDGIYTDKDRSFGDIPIEL
jgi:Fe-S-cluster-containing dehydrogenase component